MFKVTEIFLLTPWSLLAFFIVALMAFWTWWKRPHSKFPPGPRGVPFLGILPFLSEFPHEEFKKWSLKYGGVMSTRLGTRDIVILNTYEAINLAFQKQSTHFSGRMHLYVYTQVSGQLGVMFKDYNEDYKRQRAFGMQALKRGGMEKNQMEKILSQESEHLLNSLRPHTGSPFVINPLIYRASSQVASYLVLGKRFDEDDPNFNRILQILKDLFFDNKQAWKANFLMLFSFLRHFPPFRQTNKMVRSRLVELNDILQNIVNKRRDSFVPDDAEDFLGLLLQEKMKSGPEIHDDFKDEQIVIYVRDLLVAGSETSSTNICWALIYLLHHPQHYKTIMKEIDKVVGFQPFNLSMKEDLPFTCAFLQENLRYNPPAPMSHHKASSTTQLMGYTIPKGTQVTGNFYGACWDPNTWPEPEVFNPYRHINSEGKFVHSPKICAFSVGARFCMGERIARAETLFLFVSILQNFDIEAGNSLPSLKPRASNVVQPPHDFKLVLKERK